MRTRALRYFEVVAQEGSIRRAADVLHVAPSAISRQMQKLEEQLSVTLMQRHKQGMLLTTAGDQLLRFIRDMRQREDYFLSHLADAEALKTGTLRLATGGGFISDLIGNAIADFARTYPGVRIDLNICGGDEVIRLVQDDEAELGIVFHQHNNAYVESLLTCRQPLVLMVSPEHRLATCTELSLQEVAGETFAVLTEAFHIRQLLTLWENKSRIHLRAQLTCNSFDALKLYVRTGLAVTVLPRFSASSEIRDGTLHAIDLVDEVLTNTSVHLVMRKGRQTTAAMQTMRDYIGRTMEAFS